MNIWMMVTMDEYELPIVIADSASELAKKAGVTKNTIISCVSHVKNGRKTRSRYVKVEIDD